VAPGEGGEGLLVKRGKTESHHAKGTLTEETETLRGGYYFPTEESETLRVGFP